MTKAFRPKFTIATRITAGLTRIEWAHGLLLEAATLSEATFKICDSIHSGEDIVHLKNLLYV